MRRLILNQGRGQFTISGLRPRDRLAHETTPDTTTTHIIMFDPLNMTQTSKMYHIYPRSPSAQTNIVVGRCSSRLAVCPSICPSRTSFPLYRFKDFSYQPKICWDDAQYHGADRYVTWSCSANFCVLHRTLEPSMIAF